MAITKEEKINKIRSILKTGISPHQAYKEARRQGIRIRKERIYQIARSMGIYKKSKQENKKYAQMGKKSGEARRKKKQLRKKEQIPKTITIENFKSNINKVHNKVSYQKDPRGPYITIYYTMTCHHKYMRRKKLFTAGIYYRTLYKMSKDEVISFLFAASYEQGWNCPTGQTTIHVNRWEYS